MALRLTILISELNGDYYGEIPGLPTMRTGRNPKAVEQKMLAAAYLEIAKRIAEGRTIAGKRNPRTVRFRVVAAKRSRTHTR